ncbi:hypothetical protein SeLEV6574_g01374 [Synchytrium endobioticum]|uniref:propanoyl-CoA C-acyltransferase n=1 Tax=Synchytrium endobioticum TaxID=286115 RepID=A0A507DFF1_9FUNG|nr:hypothetical protein SeLEV6574_g01374 [Synchytrium endobioticum]
MDEGEVKVAGLSNGDAHIRSSPNSTANRTNNFLPINKHLRNIIPLDRNENGSAFERPSPDVQDSDNYSWNLIHFASNEALLSTQDNVDIESPMLTGSHVALDDKLDSDGEDESGAAGATLPMQDDIEEVYLPELEVSPAPSVGNAPRQNHQSGDNSPAKRRRRRRGGAGKNPYSHVDEVTNCVICGRPLREPVEFHSVFVKHVKPPIVRHMRKISNILDFPSHARVCINDLQRAMQSRIEEIMVEDELETAELQASAMKNLGEFELEESNWQAPFQKKRTIGQRAADAVARFGGSWGFVVVCVCFIALWAMLNITLTQYTGSSWDPYPFILLNFFLSMVASVQAPIIMMSQNRQNEIDHQVNDYVSTIMLRAENLIRHAQAKTDLLVGPTFRRLLEIQEIEVDLLQTLHQQHRRFMNRSHSGLLMNHRSSNATLLEAPTWTVETSPDPHARMLLHHYFGIFLEQDALIFSRAHGDGDNYIGSVENVKLEFRQGSGKDQGRLRKITYDLVFPVAVDGTLDDILAGDAHVHLRNAFDIPQLQMPGRLHSLSVHFANEVITFQNGELPPRYLPTFAPRRIDKVADLWKRSVSRITLTYSPPSQMALLSVNERQVLTRMTVNFVPPTATLGREEAGTSTVYLLKLPLSFTDASAARVPEEILKQVVGPRPLPSNWTKIAELDWSSPPCASDTNPPDRILQPRDVNLDFDLEGPGVYTFYCEETPQYSLRGRLQDQRLTGILLLSTIPTTRMGTGKDCHKVYVIGVGMTSFDKPGREQKDYVDYVLEASVKALLDAGITYDSIEMASVGYCYGDSTCGQRALYQLGLTQIPIVNVNNNCSTGSTALFLARQAVAGGMAECAMSVGFEKMAPGSLPGPLFPDREPPGALAGRLMNEIYPFNPKTPGAPQIFGNAGIEYCDKHPETKFEHMDMIAQKNHAHSTLNPYSQFRDYYTLEQVHNARTIHPPLTLLHCSPTSDGSACAIIASEAFVKKHGLEPQAVEISAQVMATDSARSFAVGGNPISAQEIAGADMTRRAAASAYKIAMISSKDVDIVELHDCFSANELITYDALGLCPPGGAGPWIASGAPFHHKFAPEGSNPDKRVPVNVSGGLISKGHPLGATGLAQCCELNWQLRGWAGDRQVPGLKIALQHNIGLGGAVVVTIYRKALGDFQAPASYVDPRQRVGYNPAVECRLISSEDVTKVVSKTGAIPPRKQFRFRSAQASL